MTNDIHCKSCGQRIQKSRKYCNWECYITDVSKSKYHPCDCCGNPTQNERYCTFNCFKKHFTQTEESIEKTRKSNKEYFGTPEARKYARLRYLKRLEKYGKIAPFFNSRASNWFREFDKKNNAQGRYALYGNGEYFVKELGVWPDYINFDTKLIIEWDEPTHYLHGKLREKDAVREHQIMDFYPNFKFMRIKEDRNGRIEIIEKQKNKTRS